LTGSHAFLNPEGLARPVGFSHIALPGPGQLVFVAGQTAEGADGSLVGSGMAGQFAAAAANLGTALEAAGAAPTDLVWLQIFVTDVDAYRAALGPIGEAYRAVFGSHYPATALFGITRLYHPDALVELMGIAVVPHV
jgi:enamine deaminase RidA (YjgF/YER057c/UK114 family)